MGRGKTTKNFIEKIKKRNLAYNQKKKTLIKKAHEFSVLCNVPICMIIFPYKETDKPSPPPEVISFKPESNDSDQASDPARAREIIDRYLKVPKEVVKNKKKSLTLSDMYEDQEELLYKNSDISEFNDGELNDYKLDYVKRKIAMMKGVVVPTYVMPSNNQGFDDQVLKDEFRPFDFEYRMFDDQIMEPVMSNDDCFGGCSTSSNLVGYNYNMNVISPTSPMYYDQGQQQPGFGDNYMPVQYFPMMSEIPIPGFYY